MNQFDLVKRHIVDATTAQTMNVVRDANKICEADLHTLIATAVLNALEQFETHIETQSRLIAQYHKMQCGMARISPGRPIEIIRS